MALRERITVAIDFVTDGATRGLGNIKSAVKDADGAVGKFKAGSQAAFAGFSQYAGQAAFAAGGALVAFGVKSVAAFQDTALGAGQLRDSLGLTAEEASRLNEVGSDLGISTEALESTIGRMNRTADSSPGKFDAIGAAIARNKDGTINVNETFLNTVDALNRIPDASRRAARAQEIFGRSWQDISELVGLGAEGVREAMESVEDAKVIDDEEIQQARDFRDAMDRLRGIFESVSLSVGERLVPKLTEAAEALSTVTEAADKVGAEKLFDVAWLNTPIGGFNALKDVALDLAKNVAGAGDESEIAAGKIDDGAEATFKWSERADYLAERLNVEVSEALRLVAERTQRIEDVSRDLQRQWDDMMGVLTDEESYLGIQDGFAKVRDAAVESWNAAAAGAEDADAKARTHRQSLIDLQQEVIDYGREVLELPPERLTTVIALIDQGKLEEAEAILAILTRNRTMTVSIETQGGIGYVPGNPYGARAHGGPVLPGGTYLVGEEGPELLQMGSQSGNVIPNDKIGWSGGGNTYVFQSLVAPSEAQLQEFGRWVDRYERRKRGGL